ncbi:MAG: hypothetical protein AAF823_07805 [Planctomycetota bacterium]
MPSTPADASARRDSVLLKAPIRRWRVFHARLDRRAPVDEPSLDLSGFDSIPSRLEFGGESLSPHELVQAETTLDLGPLTVPGGWRYRENAAWLFAEVDRDAPEEWVLSFGADWFCQWWCNGQAVAGTFQPRGNRAQPPSPLDHDLTLPLRAGRNLIAVEVLSGGGGFMLHTADADGRLDEARAVREAEHAAEKRRRRDAIRGPARVSVDANRAIGMMARPERHPSIAIQMAEPATIDAWQRHVGRAEFVRLFGAIRHEFFEQGPDATPPANDSLADRLGRLTAMADQIMTPLPGAGLDAVVVGETSLDAYEKILTAALTHLRREAPTCRWIEVYNECEVREQPIDEELYFELYCRVCRAASAADAAHPDLPPLQIGGPSPCQFKEERIRGLIQRVGASGDPSVRLDFVAWHQYLFRHEDRPADLVIGEAERVRGWLAEAGLPRNLPMHLTESGVFPTNRGSEAYADDLLAQASGSLTLHRFYMDQPPVRPYQWTWFHANPRKNQFVPTIERLDKQADMSSGPGDPIREAIRPYATEDPDRLTPFGHSATLLARLPKTRVHAEATPREAGGLGVHAIACIDDHRLGVLVWNYQFVAYDDPEHYEATLEVALPSSWPAGPVRLRRWCIDKQRGHYLGGDPSLTPLEPETLDPRSGVASIEFSLPQNAIVLMELSRP